jgi:hypothetical protein
MSETPLSRVEIARWCQLVQAWQQSGQSTLCCACCQTPLAPFGPWTFCGVCQMLTCPQCACADHTPLPPPS